MKRPTYPRRPPVVVTLKRKPTLVVGPKVDSKTEIAAKLREELRGEHKDKR